MITILRLLSIVSHGVTLEQITRRTNIPEPSLHIEELLRNGYAINIDINDEFIGSGPRFGITPKGLRKLASLDQSIESIPLLRLIKTFAKGESESSIDSEFTLEANT